MYLQKKYILHVIMYQKTLNRRKFSLHFCCIPEILVFPSLLFALLLEKKKLQLKKIVQSLKYRLKM